MRTIIFYLKWIVYFLLTIPERNKFMVREKYNTNCIDIKYGVCHDTYIFEYGQKPIRNYKTFQEFKINKYE